MIWISSVIERVISVCRLFRVREAESERVKGNGEWKRER